jgi:hypothetical protein
MEICMNELMTRKILSEARSSLEPTQADRVRMHKKVMAAVGAAGVVTAAAATAANAVGGFSTGIPPFVASIVKFVVGGLIVSGMIGMTVVMTTGGGDGKNVSSAALVDRSHRVEDTSVHTTQPLPEEVPAPKVAVPDEPARASEIAPPSEPSKEGNFRRTVNITTQKAVTPPNDDALLREIALLRSASSAVSRGDSNQGLDMLKEYDHTFPNGVMRQEREGLYISALCGVGRLREAKIAAQKFNRKYPNSPLAVRIEESCKELE